MKCCTPVARPTRRSRPRPGGLAAVVVEDPVGPLDHVTPVPLHHDGRARRDRSSDGRSGTSSTHVPYVAVHGRPSPTTATARPRRRARRGERQPGRTVADDGDVQSRSRHPPARAPPSGGTARRRRANGSSGSRNAVHRLHVDGDPAGSPQSPNASAPTGRCRRPRPRRRHPGGEAPGRLAIDEARGSRAPATTPALSVTGPCPGTTTSTSMPSIRSQAATQFDSGPAHTIGVPPMKRMSPVKIVRASGTMHEDVAAWCGPGRPRSARPAGHRRRGRGGRRTCASAASSSMPSKSNSPKKLRNSSPTSPGAAFSAGQQRRRDVGHLLGGRRRGDDLGARRPAGCRSSGRRWRGC